MQNKLQEITDKLYQEGLSKGKQEAEKIIKTATETAERIIQEAKDKAESIEAAAQKKGQDIYSNAMTEIKMSGRQFMTDLKLQIETLILSKSVNLTLDDAFKHPDFIQALLLKSVENFKTSDSNPNLAVLLPQSMQKDLDSFLKKSIGDLLNKGLEITFDKELTTGIKIQNKEQGYWISLTDQDFALLFRDYLRPKMQEILY